ncbi:hypothetical protein CEPG_00031 [Cellulophaga phage phiSM]|uniref:minor tail protein n=1 Tax=Cellulophaga phage phiSM TaxID=756280 RepID=UPI0002C0B10A|nr:minor tail protein [Cellulophaga phage phiSM]AGH07779.1 hypothetical protein CEPG_00031 [Cellulophaga phage phiSM]
MQSTVGITTRFNPTLAKNLDAQEFGGTIQTDKLTPHKDARVSRSDSRRVQSKNFINKVNAHNATKAFKNHKGTRASKFVSAVMSTVKSGKRHMILQTGEKGMLYELTSVSSNIKSKKFNFKIKKLYSVNTKTSHKVKAAGFMKKSVNLTNKKLDEYFKENAEFQFKKALK